MARLSHLAHRIRSHKTTAQVRCARARQWVPDTPTTGKNLLPMGPVLNKLSSQFPELRAETCTCHVSSRGQPPNKLSNKSPLRPKNQTQDRTQSVAIPPPTHTSMTTTIVNCKAMRWSTVGKMHLAILAGNRALRMRIMSHRPAVVSASSN